MMAKMPKIGLKDVIVKVKRPTGFYLRVRAFVLIMRFACWVGGFGGVEFETERKVEQ